MQTNRPSRAAQSGFQSFWVSVMKPVRLLVLLLAVMPALALAQLSPGVHPPASGNEQGLLCQDCGGDPDPVDPSPPPSLALDSRFVAQTVPTTMLPGQTYAVSVQMQNMGSQSWPAGGEIRLGSQNAPDNMTWGLFRVMVPTTTNSGQTATFTFNVQAPATAGNHNFQWAMVQEGIRWFGEATPNVAVAVDVATNQPTQVIGVIDAVYDDGSGVYKLVGWACSTGRNESISVHVYVGGAAGSGTLLTGQLADNSSEPAVASACQASGTAYRFSIPVSAAARKQYASQPIYVHGISPVGGSNSLIARSGVFLVPPLPTISATRSYAYDANERLCARTEPESASAILAYDAAGNIAWSAEGQSIANSAVCNDTVRAAIAADAKTAMTYDALNRVTAVRTPDGLGDTSTSYTGDGLFNQVSMKNGNTPVVNTFTYNRRRLLTSESQTVNAVQWTARYGYDANAHANSITYPGGQTVLSVLDAHGRATQVGPYATGVKYFANGAIREFTYGNGLLHTLTQTLRGMPDVSRDANGATAIVGYDADYDKNGNVAALMDIGQAGYADRGMAYDGQDRLVSAYASMWGGAATFEIDALDNLRRSTLGLAGYTYSYDANNRLASLARDGGGVYAYSSNARGDVVADGLRTLNFDANHRLRSVAGKSSYVFDAAGRRVLSLDVDGKQVRSFYSQQGALLQDQSTRTNRRTLYVQLSGDPLAELRTDTVSGAASTIYVQSDALGSPVATTDANRVVIDRTYYSPYGAPLNRPVDGVGYTGHVMDQGTGLVYMQQRYYDPTIGRFLSNDPVSTNANTGASFNRYSYANNNPYRFTDPDGRMSKEEADYKREQGQARRERHEANTRAANTGLGVSRAGGSAPITPVVEKGNYPTNAKDGQGIQAVAAVGYIDASTARGAAGRGREAAAKSGLPGDRNGPKDAMRHCTAACEVARELDPASSILLGDIHEQWYPNSPVETQMDMSNNRFGAGRSDSDGSCPGICRDAVDSNQLEIMPPSTWKD